MLKDIQDCFKVGRLLYSKHARDEMEAEEFGEIRAREVVEAVIGGKVIETYPGDEPYPSCLIYGNTLNGRPLHMVCAFARESNMVVVVTVYQPDPDRWIDFERRRT